MTFTNLLAHKLVDTLLFLCHRLKALLRLLLLTAVSILHASCIMHLRSRSYYPTSVLPAMPVNRVPAQAGVHELAGGRENPTDQQTKPRRRCAFAIFTATTASLHNTHCTLMSASKRWEFEPLGIRAASPLFTPVWGLPKLDLCSGLRAASTDENGLKSAKCLWWTNWRHLYPLLATVLACLG